jgi:hypothetical protein
MNLLKSTFREPFPYFIDGSRNPTGKVFAGLYGRRMEWECGKAGEGRCVLMGDVGWDHEIFEVVIGLMGEREEGR